MSDKEKRHIDDLFRKGSEQHAYPYNPEAWKDMEALLEKEDRKKIIFWWFGGLAGALLLIAGIIWLWPDEPMETKGNADLKKEVTSQIESNSSNNSNLDLAVNASSKEESSEEETSSSLVSKLESAQNVGGKHQDTPKNHFKKKMADPRPDQKIKDEDSQVLESNPYLTREEAPDFSIQTNLLTTLPYLTLQPLPFESTLRLKGIVENLPDDTLLTVNEEDKEGPHGFFPGLTIASEISGVGAVHLEYLDWKLGAEMQYRFKKPWALSLGFNYVHKNYDADYVDYHVPDDFWVRGIQPTYARGDCHMLEIPVQIGYFPKGFETSTFFVQGGITTYFMLSERYYYYYVEADPDLLRYWHTDQSSSYWLGVVQLNAGYQFHLGKESFRFGPYVQIPVKGVGFGQVQLNSYGLQFNYNFKI
ncbi:MAG: hypothetical protein KDC24_01035 [Saprospiraceae bacterium]|nr:hypothetical protein [Saprospiraceae bacterium]